jgi:hypothetical protein
MNFDPMVARHYFFNKQYSSNHAEEKKKNDEISNFVSMIKNISPTLRKKIMVSSDKPEYEKEEPNDVR